MASDFLNWFFDQTVRYDQLQQAFEYVRNAFDERMVDFGYAGIAPNPLTPSQQLDVVGDSPPSMEVVVSAGRGYTQEGKRFIRKTTTDQPDLSIDKDGAATTPSSGNERYVSLFILQDFSGSDDKTDGDGNTIKFQQELSHQFEIVSGVEASAGTATKPALRSDAILLMDVLLDSSTTQLTNAATPSAPTTGEIDKTRTQTWQKTAEAYLAKVVRAYEKMDILSNLGEGSTEASTPFYAESIPRAWFSGPSPCANIGALDSYHNITAIAPTANLGEYTVTMPAGLFDSADDYCVVVTTKNDPWSGTDRIWDVSSTPISATQFKFHVTREVGGFQTDAGGFNVIVIGRPAAAV